VNGNASPPNSARFLTIFEAATILRVSKQTVYRLVRAGDLEAIRVGRSFRIPTHAVRPRGATVPPRGATVPPQGRTWDDLTDASP
jgi:excisionase family DNA binding protein